MTGFNVLSGKGLKAETLGYILDLTLDEVEELYIEERHTLNKIEKDYRENEAPRVRESIKEWLDEFTPEEKYQIRREYLDYALPIARRNFLDACASWAQDKDTEWAQPELVKESVLAHIGSLEMKLHKLTRDAKILEGREEGITPELTAKARTYPLTDLLKSRNGMALCPFHDDKTASMDIRKNFYHCYGCGEQGDVIDYVMKTERLSFKEAIKRLT